MQILLKQFGEVVDRAASAEKDQMLLLSTAPQKANEKIQFLVRLTCLQLQPQNSYWRVQILQSCIIYSRFLHLTQFKALCFKNSQPYQYIVLVKMLKIKA